MKFKGLMCKREIKELCNVIIIIYRGIKINYEVGVKEEEEDKKSV